MCVVFGGDGAVATNGFWSALTMATTLKLPLLFVVEDNGYAISVKCAAANAGRPISPPIWPPRQNLKIWDGGWHDAGRKRPCSFMKPCYTPPVAGPALLRLTVPRLSGHSSVDTQAYKSKEELDAEWARDPLVGPEPRPGSGGDEQGGVARAGDAGHAERQRCPRRG